MAKPKKKPEYNSAEIAKQLVEAVTDACLNPTEDSADEHIHMPSFNTIIRKVFRVSQYSPYSS